MKLTLEPTNPKAPGQARHPQVTIEVESDDLGISEVVEDVVIPALTAWGFHPETIEKYLDATD